MHASTTIATDAAAGNGAPAPAATPEVNGDADSAPAPQMSEAPDGKTLDEGAMIALFHQAFNSVKELAFAACEDADTAQYSGIYTEPELRVLRAREKRLDDREERISDVILATPVTTVAGVLAKLRFADNYGYWSKDFANGDTSYRNALIVAILDDLEAMVAVGR